MQRGILLEIPGFQTQFYQLLMDEITSFFCLSDKQCNELFKRRLTFSSRSNIIVITANNVRWGIEKFIWDTLNTYFVPSYSSSYYSLIYLHNSMSSPIFENQRVIAVFLEHQRVSQMPLNFKKLSSNKVMLRTLQVKFLSFKMAKIQNFWVHKMHNFLNFSELVQFFILALFFQELW